MPYDIAAERQLLHEATARLIRTVDSLPDEGFDEPSGLPGWNRAHVVAHLALNGEGLAGVLAGIVRGEPTPMYPSQEARDHDIAELTAAGATTLRGRLMTGCALFDDAIGALPTDSWGTEVERTADGPRFLAAAAPSMRLREVEIHHVDLDAGYTPADWPAAFSRIVLDAMVKRVVLDPFTAAPTDLDGAWSFGQASGVDGPTVMGPAAALAWWVTGRGTGDGLTTTAEALPRITPW